MAEEFESATCKLLEQLMLLTWMSGEENNNMSFFLPLKMECFWNGNVFNTFSTSLPAMIERLLSENTNHKIQASVLNLWTSQEMVALKFIPKRCSALKLVCSRSIWFGSFKNPKVVFEIIFVCTNELSLIHQFKALV